jgi:exosortase
LSLIEQENWTAPAATPVKLTRRHVFFAVFSLALIVVTFDAIRALVAYASDLENKNASQIFLIPFVTVGLLFLKRKEIFRRARFAVIPGVLTMLFGIAVMATAGNWGLQIEGDRLALSTFAIIVVWFGGYLLFYGPSSFNAALFPLLFVLFSMPIPSIILQPTIDFLRRGSADMAYILLKLSGTPIHREGFIFVMPRMAVEVAEECSGIRSAISMLILSAIGGYMLLQTQWRRLALVCIAVPIMIFKNALRITTLSLLAVHVDPAFIESRLHREGGIPFFLVALVLIYPILMMLIRSERKQTKAVA